jgi:hypothetical protein
VHAGPRRDASPTTACSKGRGEVDVVNL